jgi:hypothetical protein
MNMESTQKTNKKRSRSRQLIISRRAEGVTHQGDTPSAPGRATSEAGLRPRMTGRKGPVTRPKGGASALRTGGRAHRSQAPSPHAPRARPPVLAGCPRCCLLCYESWVGKRGVRVREVLRGGGHRQGHSPHRGVDADASKGAGVGIPSRPSFRHPQEDGALRAKRA